MAPIRRLGTLVAAAITAGAIVLATLVAAPAAVAAWAQTECATRCSVEKVEKIAMNQSQKPAASASEGQR